MGPPGPGFGPPRSSNTGVIIGVIVGGGFVLLLVVAIVLAASGAFSGSSGKAPEDQLATAAQSLSGARAIQLKGSVGSGTDQLEGDLTVTKGGRATGDVTWNGKDAKVLVVDDKVFVKADADFWRDQSSLTTLSSTSIDPERWGKTTGYSLTTGVKTGLTPSAFAAKMRRVGKYGIRTTARTTVGGKPALKIITYSDTFYLSTGDSPKLLRVEQTYPQVSADVAELAGTAADGSVSELRSRVGELKDSFDTSQIPRTEQVKFGSCTDSGCTVRSRVWSTHTDAPSARLQVRMWLTASTQTGRKLGECTADATIDSSSSVWTSCRITGASWKSFHSGSGYRKWWAHGRATVMGTTSSEVQSMLDGIDKE